MSYTDARKLSRTAQDAIRKQAVRAVLEGKLTQTKAAEVFGVSRTSVCLWVKAYRSGGTKALASKARGRPKGAKASRDQVQDILKVISSSAPEDNGLTPGLWSRNKIAELFRVRHGLEISRWTASRYLKHWGLGQFFPPKHFLDRNPAKAMAWFEGRYLVIKDLAALEKARIWWGAMVAGVPKPGTSSITAVSNRNELRFLTSDEAPKSQGLKKFLKQMMDHSPQEKIFIILDSGLINTARDLESWLAKNSRNIRLFFLVHKSGDFDPDQLTNADVIDRLATEAAFAARSNSKSHDILMGIQKKLYSKL